MRLLLTRCLLLCDFVVVETTTNLVVYDPQLFSV